MLPVQLSHLGLGDKTSLVSRFVECFKTMWSNNGDLVSRTYTGTGAMEGGARVRRWWCGSCVGSRDAETAADKKGFNCRHSL